MKKINKLLLMTVIGLSALFVKATVFAEGALDITSQELICEPAAIEPGGKADCYIVGRENNNTHVSHGVVVQFYTEDKLSVTGAKVNDRIKDSASALVKRATDPTTGNGDSLNAVDGVKNFKCEVAILPSGEVRDSGCIIYYTTGTDATAAGVFTKDNLKKPQNVSEYLSGKMGEDANLVVLGHMVVKLDEDNKNENCGNVCWKTWSIPTAGLYDKYVTCSQNGSSDPDCGTTAVPSSEKKCQDLKMLVSGTPENTITGSFVSYTILAAGILLAISAVAIAKKNNKLQKI